MLPRLNWTCFSACLVLCIGSASFAEDAPAPPADYDQLLDGVKKIAICGTPGSFALFSPQAFPLIAAQHERNLVAVVAATRLGKGRTVNFGHNGYFGRQTLEAADTGRLMLNAVRWAGGQKEKGPRAGVRGAGELLKFLAANGLDAKAAGKDLASFDVLCIEGGAFGGAEEFAAVKGFVENGGGLVTGGCPWGWAQVTGKALRTEYPLNRLLGPAGLVAADTYVGPTTEGGFTVANPPEKLLHTSAALDLLIAQSKGTASPTKAQLAQASHTVSLTAHSILPEDQLILPRLRALAKETGTAAVPMPDKPIKAENGLARVLVALEDMDLHSLPLEQIKPHPAAKGFPYEVPADAKRASREIQVDTKVPAWHSTGLYAAPGEVIEITIPEAAAGKGLGLRIGAHTDGLWHLDAWQRWPSISWHAELKKPVTRLANPFGGLIYVEVPDRAKLDALAVQIANAVEAPYYVLNKTSLKEWRDSVRLRPAPWAELECSGIILTVPSTVVRTLDDPEALMQFWSKVIQAQDELAAWKPEDRKRPERMVCDQQISAGYMHSGYPIMTFLDVIATNVSVTKLTTVGEKAWGQWHELGHNHQSGDWTPEGCGEVTVNLFSMYVINTVHGLPLENTRPDQLQPRKRLAKIKAYLASAQTPRNWDPFTGLVLYYQLVDGFGWDALKKVMAEYRTLSPGQHPKNDVGKWDQWMVRYSKAVGKDLGPFFQKWKVPVTQAALDAVKDLPAWMHNDFNAPELDAAKPGK